MAEERARAELVGLIDPSGLMLGFLIPVFRDEIRNAPLAQRVDASGRIAGFEPADEPDATLVKVGRAAATEGDTAYWAFALGGDCVIVGNDGGALERLANILDDPKLRARPMLAMEVAEFLEMGERRDVFAADAYRNIAKASAVGARGWRDLSVLTSDIRRILARLRGRNEAWTKNIVLAIVGDEVVVQGVEKSLTDQQIKVLSEAIDEATRAMPRLFAIPNGGWRIAFIKTADEEHVDARLMVVGRVADDLRKRLLRPGGLTLELATVSGLDTPAKLFSETKAPLFIVYDSRDPQSSGEAIEFSRRYRATAIALGTLPRLLPDHGPTFLSRYPETLIELPNSGVFRASRPQGTDAVAIQLAVAVGIEARQQRIELPHPRSILLRAAGVADDATVPAALYDRAWSLGLVPWDSVRIASAPDPVDSRDEGSIARALFDDVPVADTPTIRRALASSRASSALLVSSNAADEHDERNHGTRTKNMFAIQRWKVSDTVRGKNHPIHVFGACTEFTVFAERPPPEPPRNWNLEEILSAGLENVDRLRVTCAASPGAVLAHLSQTRELVVNMRDLVGLRPETATIWSVAGAQLRRMVTAMHGRPRTHLIALFVQGALRAERVSYPDAGILQEAIMSGSLGEASHFVLDSVKRFDHAAIANVRLVASSRNPYAPLGADLAMPFRLNVLSGGPAIERREAD
jgi:hypothetical protein